MADPEETRRFDDIVAHLHEDDPGFTAAFHEPRRPPGRLPIIIGAVLCAVALALLMFGGAKGAVLAVLPWLAGMAFALKGRG
ncbi:DUF3040 domain-containing protein [Actinoplanes sp. NPDC049681]|uniref:DUF3040 domain-containing protein n=1 Tax=Actinoplanes sp. NPDC049681 TaxID=3363905 RepID=UPI0037AD45F6